MYVAGISTPAASPTNEKVSLLEFDFPVMVSAPPSFEAAISAPLSNDTYSAFASCVTL